MEKYIPTSTIKNQGRPPWFGSEPINFCKKRRHGYKRSIKQKKHLKIMLVSLNVWNVKKNLKEMIERKMETNLNDDENDQAVLSKKFWSHLKSTDKSTLILDSVYYNEYYKNLVAKFQNLPGKCWNFATK